MQQGSLGSVLSKERSGRVLCATSACVRADEDPSPSEVPATIKLLSTLYFHRMFWVGSHHRIIELDAPFETDFRAASHFSHFPAGQGRRAFSAIRN